MMGPRVPQQARSRAKYTAILEAALELFRERGYTETTVDAIVERSGVSVGVFYSYFASKQQLLLSLFEQEMATEDTAMFSLPRRRLTVDETRQLISQFLSQERGLRRAWQELLLIHPEYRQYEREYQLRRHEKLAWELEQLRLAGYIRNDIRTLTCAWVLLSIFARLVDMVDELSEQEVEREVRSTALLIYYMLHTDETTPHKEEQKSANTERSHDPSSTEN